MTVTLTTSSVPRAIASALVYVALVVGILGFALRAHDNEVAARALLTQRLAAQQNVIDSLASEAVRRDTVFRTDTLRLTRTVARWDTLYAERRYTDTLWVKETLAQGEETIKSCRVAVADCAALATTLKSEVAAQRQQLADLRSSFPGTRQRLSDGGKGAAIGAALVLIFQQVHR